MKRAYANLEEYRKYVAEMAANADGRVILNHDAEHASIVIAQIFQSSGSEVDLLTGSLDIKVYGNPALIEAAKRFVSLNDHAKIRIAHEQAIDPMHPLLLAVANAGQPSQIQMSEVSAAMQKKYDFHFAIGDDRHFRFEFSRNECEAMVKFGAFDQGRQLHEIFDRLTTFQKPCETAGMAA